MPHKKIITFAFLGCVGLAATVGLIMFVHIADLAGSLPSSAELDSIAYDQTPLATEVFDRHGTKIGEFAEQRRYHVALEKIPKQLTSRRLVTCDNHRTWWCNKCCSDHFHFHCVLIGSDIFGFGIHSPSRLDVNCFISS